MSHQRGTVLSRLGGISRQTVQRVPTVEYVNRAGQHVNPHNGKPYSRPTAVRPSANGHLPKKKVKKQQSVQVKTCGVMFGGLSPIPTVYTIDPPPRVCFNCWQKGHTRKTCPRPVVDKFCTNCGRRNVDISTCPRCQVAHVRYLAHLRGEKLEPKVLAELFPQERQLQMGDDELVYTTEREVDDDCDDVLQQIIEQEDRERAGYFHEEHETEERYREPRVQYVETREYVKNPVSRSREYDDEEEVHRRRDEYEREHRERSYEERDRKERSRYRERESSEDRSVERYGRKSTSFADNDTDPVQEVLELAKSIAHLSPETQELIMKQVMAERKEKARLRAMQQQVVDEDWP